MSVEFVGSVSNRNASEIILRVQELVAKDSTQTQVA